MPLRLSFPGPMWVECERVQRLISYSFWRSRVCLICDYCLFSLFSLISLSARNERSAETVLKCWLYYVTAANPPATMNLLLCTLYMAGATAMQVRIV